MLDGQGIESRWGEIFRTRPEHPWGPISLLCSGHRVPVPGVKCPGRGVDHTPKYGDEVTERVDLYLYSLSRTSLPVVNGTGVLKLMEICFSDYGHKKWRTEKNRDLFCNRDTVTVDVGSISAVLLLLVQLSLDGTVTNEYCGTSYGPYPFLVQILA